MASPIYENEKEMEPWVTRSKNTRCTKAVKAYRINRLMRMCAGGASQQDVVQYCGSEWGLSVRHSRMYYKEAISEIKASWELDRAEFAALLLQQLNDLHKKTSNRQNDSVTLGCINSAAKIARLFD